MTSPRHHATVLRRRQLFRRIITVWFLLIGLFIGIDHFGQFGYLGDDWSRYDAHLFTVAAILPNGDLTLEGDEVQVHMLGVNPTAAAVPYLHEKLHLRQVILKLESPQTRDDRHRLLAYVYLDVSDCVNIDLVHAGLARMDRERKYHLRPLLERAEGDARKHRRGVWGAPPANEPTK